MQNENTTIAQNAGSEMADFLRDIWPAEGNGIYALMTLPDRKHYQFHTITEAVAGALELDTTPSVVSVYHACATYREASYIDDKGKNRFRTQYNALAIRSMWLDIDCGSEKAASGEGYATKNEGARALRGFLSEHGLPAPTIIDSGNGLHIYWAFREAVAPEVWRATAGKLATLAAKAGLRADPSRTTDYASVLRPVGTTNRKDRSAPKPVKIKYRGGAVDATEFDGALASALANLGEVPTPTTGPMEVPEYMKKDGGNLSDFGKEFPPSSLVTVAQHCQQIKLFATTGCEDEPTWHKCLGVAVHCEDGTETAHAWSAMYDGYDYAETQTKLDQWSTGPTTCDTFRKINPSGCDGCQHKCKSPIQLGLAENERQPDWLPEMNARYAYINKEAAIYRLKHRDFIASEKFHMAHANEMIEVAAGNGTKHVSVTHLWLRHKSRRQHEAIVTRPGESEITEDNCLNDWAGYSCEPCAGDVRPFLRLYEYLFDDERFALRWLAHLIQHPGVKMFVALVIWSQAEGVGKNLLFEAVGGLFNLRHFALIGQSEVDDDFCGWIPGKVFVVADEVRASKSDKSRDRLKLWQTSTRLRSHDKGQPKREDENLMNMVFLSNHADGMFLSDHDRRFFVHEVKAGPLPETIKREFLAWRENDGLAYLLHHLQQIDLDGFDPKGRAPLTASKVEMIEASRSDLDRWAHDVVSGALPVGKEVATGEDLARRFCIEYPNLRQPPSVATVVKVFVRAGAVRRENQIRLANGRKVRALALLRPDYWKGAPETAWRDELEQTR